MIEHKVFNEMGSLICEIAFIAQAVDALSEVDSIGTIVKQLEAHAALRQARLAEIKEENVSD